MKKKILIVVIVVVVLAIIYYVIKKMPAKKGQITNLNLGIIPNPNAPVTEKDFNDLSTLVTKLGGDIFLIPQDKLAEAKAKYLKNAKQQQHQELMSLFKSCTTSACKNLSKDEMDRLTLLMKTTFELK